MLLPIHEERYKDSAPTWVLWLVTLVLIAHSGLLAWRGSIKSPTYDEPGHLVAGVYYWQYGRFDLYCVNPPLVRLVAALPTVLVQPETNWYHYLDLPLARQEFTLGRDFVTANGMDAVRYTTWGRWACIPFSLLGAFVCFRWVRELFGNLAGLTALTLWCFSPTTLGNGSLITSDVAAASMGVFALYSFRNWLRAPTHERALGAGIVFGLALLTKTTWVILFPLLPLLWLTTRLLQRCGGGQKPLFAEAAQMGGLLLSGLVMLNLGYGFEGTFQRLEDYSFRSESLGGKAADNSHDANRFRESWLGSIPVPLPKSFLQGIDLQKKDLQGSEKSPCCLHSSPKGCWYYYLAGLAWKIPLGLWVLAVLSVRFPLRWRIPLEDRILLIIPAALIWVLVSTNRGVVFYRYLLPVLPFLFIGVSSSVKLAVEGSLFRKIVTGSAVVWFVASSLSVYPHSQHYFNELVGGAKQGHLSYWDSSVDWGQDLLLLKDWLESHPEARPLHVACQCSYDPKSIGIEYESLHTSSVGELPGPLPAGWYAISETALYQDMAYMVLEEPENVQVFSRLQDKLKSRPVARIGLSIYIFHIPENEIPGNEED